MPGEPGGRKESGITYQGTGEEIEKSRLGGLTQAACNLEIEIYPNLY